MRVANQQTVPAPTTSIPKLWCSATFHRPRLKSCNKGSLRPWIRELTRTALATRTAPQSSTRSTNWLSRTNWTPSSKTFSPASARSFRNRVTSHKLNLYSLNNKNRCSLSSIKKWVPKVAADLLAWLQVGWLPSNYYSKEVLVSSRKIPLKTTWRIRGIYYICCCRPSNCSKSSRWCKWSRTTTPKETFKP